MGGGKGTSQSTNFFITPSSSPDPFAHLLVVFLQPSIEDQVNQVTPLFQKIF